MNNILSTMSDVELITKFQHDSLNSSVVEALLGRYDFLIKKLAHSHTKKHSFTTLEDNLQNAKVGAILAFKRFKAQSRCKPLTFVYSTIYHYLLTCNDEEAFVNCPSNMREVRSYLGGKFENDLTRKNAFEKKYDIKNQDDISSVYKKYEILKPDSIICEDFLPEIEYDNENSIVERVNQKLFLESLSQEDFQIVYLLSEGHSQSQISKMLRKSTKQISTKLNSIKQKLVQYN